MIRELTCEFLGDLERDEARLLGWALVDGFFSQEELEDRAEAFLEKANAWSTFNSASDLMTEMQVRGLLFSWVVNGMERRYRTRMAETVRLIAGMKQLFPKHLKRPGEWQAAPSLVSDFRFLNRPRQYPQRDQSPSDWLPTWSNSSPSLSPLQVEVMSTLLRKPDGQFIDLGGFQVRATTRILQEVHSDKISANNGVRRNRQWKDLGNSICLLSRILWDSLNEIRLPGSALWQYTLEMNFLRIRLARHCRRHEGCGLSSRQTGSGL